MSDSEQNRFAARAARYVRVGTNVGAVAARVAGSRLFGIEHDGWWLHIGNPDGRDKAEEFLRELCHSEA